MRAGVLTSIVVAVAAGIVAVASSCVPAQASAATLQVTSPAAYQVVQRDADGLGNVVVRGVCRGLGGRVQASWNDGLWSSAVVRADGTFRIVLKDRPAGQAALEVRAVDHPDVLRTVPYVGVGDVFVIAGQSNASGRGFQYSRYSHTWLRATLFGNDDRWKDLRDPVDSPVGQVDRVSRDTLAAGTVWPLVATGLMQADPVPVAFITCPRSSTSITQWLPDADQPYARTTLYGSMVRRVRAAGSRVRAVLYWQGEADARAGMPREEYVLGLRRLAAAVDRDINAPLVAAQIGDYDQRYTAEGVNGIRLAQQDTWSGGWTVPGPVLYDVDLHGRVHFTQPSELQVAAHRWTAAILGGVHRLGVPSAPMLRDAQYDGREQVTLRFRCEGGLRLGAVSGITLTTAEGVPVAYQYAVASGPDEVSLYLFAAVDEPLVVSLGSGRDSAGQRVPVEASWWALPALPFVGVFVEMPEDWSGWARGRPLIP